MGAIMFFFVLFVVIAAIAGVVVLGPAALGYLGSGNLRKELRETKTQYKIAVTALREIRTNDGGNAYLIADIALSDIESRELKELS